MKLLTSTGLLYSAVQSQTVDGHYGTYPELDWTTFVAESVQSRTIATSLGLNPMIRSIETGWDGGKILSGYGWFSGTTTTGWLMKLYGTRNCGNGSVVSIAAGYNTFTISATKAASTTTCVTQAAWVWTVLNATIVAGNYFNQGTIVVDAIEEWMHGGTLTAGTAGGTDVLYYAVGGISAHASFGLGIWNMMLWTADHNGDSCTTAKCGGTWVQQGEAGYDGTNLHIMGQAINASKYAQGGALNTSMQNYCFTSTSMWMKQQGAGWGGDPTVLVTGFIGSNTGCLDYVTDEINISGMYTLLSFGVITDMEVTPAFSASQVPGTVRTAQKPTTATLGTATANKPLAADTMQYVPSNTYRPIDTPIALVSGTANDRIYAWNYGAPKQVVRVNGNNLNASAAVHMTCLVLFSAPEQYGKSALIAHNNGAAGTTIITSANAEDSMWIFKQAEHGMIQHVWPFCKDNSGDSVGLWNTTDTHVAWTGMRLGKGIFSLALFNTTTAAARTALLAGDIKAEGTPTAPVWMSDAATGVSYNTGVAYTRVFKSPSGGVAQFKGLTQDATNDQYVEVNCRQIHPYFQNVAWKDISNSTTTTATSGFIVTCMTGISQCINDNSIAVASRAAGTSLLTTTEHAACLNDPRYLTWRQMTLTISWGGTVQWWRTDSFWNPTDYVVASSWGPGTIMSSHISSGTDNTTITATDQSKSYVFALSDGSGVQLSHITGGSAIVTAPTANTSAGSGANTLTSALSTFKNTAPNRYDQNYCSSTNLNLTGLADTSALAAAVTAYSDGYQATITMTLDWVQAGAQGGWRGVCIVYYTSQYIQDDTNGAVCMAAVQSTGTGMGSDLGGVYLIHVPATTWQPPASTGSVSPASLALTDAKYGITNTPAATKYTYTGGYYASSAWYQPKYASSYADIARFGKDRYTGAYCMQGSGATSYFSAPAAGVQLQSAVTLAAGAIALGSAILAM